MELLSASEFTGVPGTLGCTPRPRYLFFLGCPRPFFCFTDTCGEAEIPSPSELHLAHFEFPDDQFIGINRAVSGRYRAQAFDVKAS